MQPIIFQINVLFITVLNYIYKYFDTIGLEYLNIASFFRRFIRYVDMKIKQHMIMTRS